MKGLGWSAPLNADSRIANWGGIPIHARQPTGRTAKVDAGIVLYSGAADGLAERLDRSARPNQLLSLGPRRWPRRCRSKGRLLRAAQGIAAAIREVQEIGNGGQAIESFGYIEAADLIKRLHKIHDAFWVEIGDYCRAWQFTLARARMGTRTG